MSNFELETLTITGMTIPMTGAHSVTEGQQLTELHSVSENS